MEVQATIIKNRLQAINILTPSIKNKSSIEDKKQAIKFLIVNQIDDELSIRVLILSLANAEIQSEGLNAIASLLDETESVEKRDAIIRQICINVFDNYFNAEYAGDRLLETLIKFIRDRLPNTSDYVSTLMLYAGNAGRKIEMSNKSLARTLVRFTNTNPEVWANGKRSKKAFSDFNGELALRTLIDPENATPKYLLQILKRFNTKNIEEISLEIVAAHASLLSKVTYDNEEKKGIIDQALKNLVVWSDTINAEPENILNEWRIIKAWSPSDPNNENELSNTALRTIAFNHLLTKPIRDALIDKINNIADKKSLFLILSKLTLSRDVQIVFPITDYILRIVNDNRGILTFPFSEAVDFLANHLIGLNRFLHLSEDEQKQIFKVDDHTNAPKLKPKDIQYAEKIIQVLDSIVKNSKISIAIRQQALKAVVQVIPNQLVALIESWKLSLDTAPTLKSTLFEELGKIKHLESLPYLLREWQSRGANPLNEKKILLRAIAEIGTYRILGEYKESNGMMQPNLLLKDVFEEEDEELKTAINDLLRSKGFMLEIERESKRREIYQNIKLQNETAKNITKNEAKSQQADIDIKDSQGIFNDSTFRMNLSNNDIQISSTKAGIDLLLINLDANEVRAKLDILRIEASKLENQVNILHQRTGQEQANANKLRDQLRTLDQKIRSIETEIRSEDKNCLNAKNKIDQSRREIAEGERSAANLDNSINQTNQRLNARERELATSKREENYAKNQVARAKNAPNSEQRSRNISRAKQELSSARSKVNNKQSQIRSLERDIKKLNSQRRDATQKIERAKRAKADAKRIIRNAEQKQSHLKSAILEITSRRQGIEPRITASQNKISRFQQEIKQQRMSLEQLKKRINSLKSDLAQVEAAQRQVKRQFNSETSVIQKSYDQHRSKAVNAKDQLLQFKAQLTNAINNIERSKTKYQKLAQKMVENREQFDTLGDDCFRNTPIKNKEHESESRDKKIQRLDKDFRKHTHFRAVKTGRTKFHEKHPKAADISKSQPQSKQKNKT